MVLARLACSFLFLLPLRAALRSLSSGSRWRTLDLIFDFDYSLSFGSFLFWILYGGPYSLTLVQLTAKLVCYKME